MTRPKGAPGWRVLPGGRGGAAPRQGEGAAQRTEDVAARLGWVVVRPCDEEPPRDWP